MSQSLRLEHSIYAPGLARAWISERCREWRCDELVGSAALLITELVTNVFLHARTDCLIDATFDDFILAVTVTDWDAHEPVIRQANPSAESGRGLAILDTVADAWGIQLADGAEHPLGAKSVWFRLNDNRP
jgi:anti-sigma regulatory factor (Ser/Thr protein kinase)